MSDLNPTLTEFDKSVVTTDVLPEMKPFSVWTDENNVADNEPQSYVQYTDYLRESYSDGGSYNKDVERELRGALNGKLQEFYGEDQEAIAQATAIKEIPFEEKVGYLYAQLDSSDPDAAILGSYRGGQAVIDSGSQPITEEYQQKIDGLREQAEQIVGNRFDQVKRNLVDSGQLPLAYVTNDDGDQELIAGDAADNLSTTQAIKASKIGGVHMADALLAQTMLSPVGGTELPLYKFRRIREISKGISTLAKADSAVSEHIEGHARGLARTNNGEGMVSGFFEAMSDYFGDALNAVGVGDDESNDRRNRVLQNSRQTQESFILSLTYKLNEAGGNYSQDDVRSAYEHQVVEHGVGNGSFELHQDAKDAGKNLFKTSLGPILNPKVFTREGDLEKTLAAHPDLSEEQKTAFMGGREDFLRQNFSHFSKTISESAVGDDWVAALVEGRQAGKDDLEIFDKFVEVDDNYNEFAAGAKGTAWSVIESFESLFYLAPAMFGNDWAKNGLADVSERQSKRREIAEIFGEQYGLFRDVTESIAPMAVDVAATVLLSIPTAGAGGAAYLTVKSGANLTAKGLAKALTSNVLRASTEEGYKSVARKAVANGLIKESLESKGRAKTIKALEAFNNQTAQKFGITAASFIPATTRSTAMSYGSLYSQFRNDPNMTEEQAHDRALGFALTSGVITGVITAGFSSIGRGGVETALLRGASFNQVKNTLKALSNTSGISDKTVADVIKKVSSDSIKKLGKPSSIAKGVGRGAVDEGFEEAVDQFVNSFVEDIALDQNTPMLERMKQVWHAAQVGGVLGGGVPALQAVGSKLKVTPMDGRIQAARAQEQFYIDVEESLKSTGSPLSADQVKSLAGTRARGAGQKTFEPSPDQSTGSTSEISRRETDLKIKELTQSETALSQELEGLSDVTVPSGDDTLSLSPEASRKAAIISELEVVRQSLDQENNLRETLDSPTIETAVESSEGDLEAEALLRLMNDVSPLDVEAAFNNQLQINLGSSENVDTIVFLDDSVQDSVQPANVALNVDYTNQQMRSSSVGVDSLSESKLHTAAENAKSSEVASEGSKSYTTRPTPTTVSFAESPFTGLNSEERTTRFYQYAQETGFPVNVRPNASYGLPLPEKSGPARRSTSVRAMSDLVNSTIYSIYPVSEPPAMMKVTPYSSKQASKTYFDPKSGKTTLQKVKGYIDKDGNGVFNNDPVVMADMIQSGLEIKVPRDFNRSKLNPSIRIKDGFVADVVGPVADGSGVLESKTTSLKQVSPIEPNTLMSLIISRIPFKKASSLPAGVKDFNPLNGGPLAEDFSDTTGIKLRVKKYELEIAKTGSELNRLAQDRLISDSGELSTEYKLAALEDAKQRFLFNAQLFGLRDKLIREPSSIKKEIISQTNSRSLDEAAQRLIPFVSLKEKAQLDSDSILDLFIDQKLQNNPDFANNTPPTFDSLLTKSVRVFKSQNEAADTLNKARAANTLPSDMTPESFENERVMNFVANFGLNPVGDLAPAEVINSSVSKAMDDAIEAINTDSSLRRTINRITLESIVNDSPEANKLVDNASARDIFGIFTSWMASGNANARQSVNDLMVSLANGEYVSGDSLEQALLLTTLSNRADGAGYENSDAVSQYRDILSSASGREISMDEARNTMISMSKAVRVHLSRSNVTESQRQSIETQNYADIQRLGLKSGDPKSVVAALKQIAKDSDVPSHKVVADLLLQDEAFVGRVNFVVAEGTADIAGKYIKQQDGGHSVYINPTTGNGRGLVNTLLEEYVHAFTSDTLNTPREQLKKSRRGVLSVLTQLETVLANARSAYKNQVAPSGGNAVLENALSDVEEFLAQFLLSSDVQKFVKALAPPKGATPFFERFINKIVRLFPKVSSSEAKGYTDALMDVLDIGNNSYKTTTTDAKAFGSSTARRVLASAPVKDTGDSALDEDLSAREQLEADAVINAEAQAEADKLEQYISSLPEADRVGAREAISLVQNLSPVGLKVMIDPDSPYPAYVREDSATIFINPKLLADRVRGVDALSKRMLIGGIVHEEVAHTASFSALSDAEIQRYINELSDADYVDIAESYYANSPENFLKESLERLRSEDPKVVADEKYALAEEKLRMHLQKVTRGFTTEDDVLFWKSNPSLLAILKRYFTGIINRWAMNKKRLGGVGDATFNKILVEMRAIEAGFMRQPRKMAFDPEFPISSFMMFEKANQDYTGLALAASITSDEYPESAGFPTSAFNTLHGGMEIPSGLSDNNAVAAYLREMAVEFWGVEVNEDGGKPKGDEETFLTPVTAKSITEEQEAKIVALALQEVSQALAASGENAGNWYTTAIEAAMAVASVVYPELANSQLAKDIKAFSDAKNPQLAADLTMKLSLAITSQNLKVSQNTEAADEQYKIFRETGKFDDSVVYGSKGAAIQSNMTLANILIEKLGFDESIEFIESDFTVKSLNKTLKDMGFVGIKVAGLANTEVQGAAIFGPKIGQGFLQNLRASVMKEEGKGYIPVTVDLWLRRTWGRWTGDSAGKGLTTSLAAEFLTVAKKTKSMPAVTEDLIKKVADTYAQIDLEDASAKADATHISRAKVALNEARSLRVNSTGKDLTKGSAKKLIDNRDIQIALFGMGKFVNSRGEAAYKRTREPFPPKIIENIREGNFDPLEIYTYLEKRNKEFEDIYQSKLSVKGVPKAQIKLKFLKDFDGSEEVMEAIEVRDLKLPWQNVAKRVKESIKPIDSPTNLEREVISRVINKVRIELESRGMTTTNADIQAILWYPEKDIWQKLQGGDASNLKQSYDEAYLEIAKNLDPETYEKAIKERNRVLNRGRDRAARNSVAPQQGADGRVNREAVGESDSTQASGRSLAAAPVGRPEQTRDRRGRDSSGSLAPLEGAPSIRAASGPDPRLVEAANRYAQKVGLKHQRQAEYVRVDPEFATRVAQAYEDMDHDPSSTEVKEAYANLIKQTISQYESLVEAGYDLWFIDPVKDPYEGNPFNAMRDLRANKSMGVFPTEAGFGSGDADVSGNPLEEYTEFEWSYGSPTGPKRPVTANDLLRAVHDAFGHGLEGSGFRPRGEENAWQAHVRLFTGSAVAAITSETRGQNSWVNYGPHGEANRTAKVEDTIFADQKTGLMPSWTWEENKAQDEKAGGRSLAAAPVGRPALDAPYLAAVESGDVEAQQRMVDAAIQNSNYKAKGVRAGVYRDGVPLLPSERGLLGSGFYAVLDGKKEDVRQFAGPLVGPERNDKSLESRVDDLAIDLGYNPIFIDGTDGINKYIRENGLEEQFETWLAYQDAVNTAYKSVGAKRTESLETVRGGTIQRDLENVDTYAGAGFKSQNTRNDANFLLDRVVSAIVVDHSKSSGERDFKEVVVANPNQIKSAEPVTKDESGNVIPLSQRFDTRSDRILSAAPVGGGVGGSIPTGTNIDHTRMVELLEIPVYELESDKPSNFITDFLYRLFAGEVSEPFRRLIENRDAYKRATEKNVAAYKKTLDELIEKAYGGIENAPTERLAKAQGYQSGDLVSSGVLDGIDAKYEALISDIEKDRKAKKIDKSEAKSRKALAINKRDAEIEKVNKDAADAAKVDRDNALREIARDSPELASHIIDIREELIIPLQKKLIEADLDSKIGIKISNTGGIYVTRSYRMFTDSSYYAEISESKDQKYVDLRNEAIAFFEDKFLKDTKAKLVAGNMDPSKAAVKAKEDLDSRGDWGQQTLNTFLIQYKDGGRDSTTSSPRDYKLIADNLKRRKDLPKALRKLLGEYDAESGTDLILRTYSTVAMLASQQSFLTQLHFYGEKSKLLVSEEEYRATEESRRKYDEAGFVQAREGGAIHGISDPLAGMRIHPEFKRDLDKTLKDSYILDNADTAQKAVEGVFGIVANLSGKSMALKTLGSIGFYFRNAIGNLLFGASQGYFRFDQMVASMRKESIKAISGNLDNLDPELAELVGLNVVGDELRAGVIRDLLNGRTSPEGVSKQIAKLADKTHLSKIGKSVAWAEKKAQDLSAAVDAGYKIVYYQHELGILREAQAADPDGMGAMRDREIKRLAARKVIMTAQAYSQAPPAVQAWTKSPLGLVFAPFIRFKVEVPRIVINTFKLANEEIKTGNPVLVRRGRYRRYSMMTMLGGVSSAIPMILAAMAGIGDDEDEAIRASIPDYLRSHSFYYFGKGENLKSVDLTYLNPFALMTDPFLRAYENLSRGEYSKAGASLVLGIIKDQYLDDQILAGAVRDATRNVNPSTGKPIWNAGSDSPLEVMTKTLGYVAKEAYAPRIGKDIAEGWATGTLSGMGGEILEGAVPFRIHDVDLQKQYQRYLLDLNKRYTNVKGELGQLMSSKPISDGSIRGIIDENIEDRTLLNRELLRINKGFSGLGLSDIDLLRTMKDKGVGKNRIMLLSRGYMDRPSVKYIMENLLEERNKEYGPERAQKILDYYQNLNRYLPVVPIDGPE